MRKFILPAAAVLALLLLFAVGIYELIFVPSGEAFSETENRLLAERPDLSGSSYLDGSFADGVESFLSDRFPWRAGIIRTSQAIRDAGSFATWEDYVKVAENDVADMQYQEELSDDERIVTPRPTRTPAPTEPPTPDPTPAGSLSPGQSSAPTPDPTPTPVPSPTLRPTKPPADASDFPKEMKCTLLSGEATSVIYKGERKRLQKIAALLDAYASLLPEDGVLTFTVVPYSTRANRLSAYRDPQGFSSEIEPFIHAVTEDRVAAFCTAELLAEPLIHGEYVFFRSDMHWTPYGAYLVVSRMMEEAGETLPPYDAFPKEQEYPFLGTIYRDKPTNQMRDNPDTLDIVSPTHPVRVLRYETAETYSEIPLIKTDAHARDRYTVYLGGPGNLAVIERTDAGDGEKKTCFVITDSYGLCTAPFFAEVYDRVIVYDPRYYKKAQMGSVADLIEKNEVMDIYVIVGDSHALSEDGYFASCNNQF